MANKVVIDTEIKARGYEEVQRDIEKTIKEQEKLQARFDKFNATGGDQKSKAFRGMQYDASVLENRLEDLNEELSRVSRSGLENTRTACERASKSIEKCGKSAKKSSSNFSIGLKSILKYAFGIRSLFVLINKLRTALVNGFKNLAQFNDGVNPVNTALSNLMSALTQLKNSFASAFAPILTVVEPILTSLISGLTNAMNVIGQFIASLTGQKTFTKAITVQQNYAKSLYGTAKSAKEAKKQLAGFYDLNVINTKEDEAGTSVSPNDMFETVEIENNISAIAERVKNIFNEIKEMLNPFTEKIGTAFEWLLTNVLEPLSNWTMNELVPKFIELIASALEALSTAIEVLEPYAMDIWDNFLKPIGEWTGEIIIGAIEGLTKAFKSFSDWCKEDKQNVELMASVLLGFLAGLTTYLIVKKISSWVTTFKNALKTFIAVMSGGTSSILLGAIAIGALAAGIYALYKNWDKLTPAQRAITILGALAAAAIAAAVAIAVFHTAWSVGLAAAAIAGGLALLGLSFSLANSNSKTASANQESATSFYNSYDFNSSILPRLATGTVVPRQSQEFMAILGDNNRETEVVSPLSTMKQAFIEALAESNIAGNSNVTVVLEGDAKGLFKVVRKEANDYSYRTGNPAFN